MDFEQTISNYVDKKVVNALSDFLKEKNFIPSAEIIASAFGALSPLFEKNTSCTETKLISSFEKNLTLLVQKTWIEKSDAELKENVLYKLHEYCASVADANWQDNYSTLLEIIGDVVYLMFGPQSKSADFTEYALRIDPEFGIFWVYIKSLPAEQSWTKEKIRTAMLLGMYFLANY